MRQTDKDSILPCVNHLSPDFNTGEVQQPVIEPVIKPEQAINVGEAEYNNQGAGGKSAVRPSGPNPITEMMHLIGSLLSRTGLCIDLIDGCAGLEPDKCDVQDEYFCPKACGKCEF